MTDPTKEPLERKPDEVTMTTGIARAVRQLESPGAGSLEPLPLNEESLPASTSASVHGPLFPKKVMVGWALLALTVWFALTFIAPIVIESVKTAVVESLEPSVTNTAIPTPPTTATQPVVAPAPEGSAVQGSGPAGAGPAGAAPAGPTRVVPPPAAPAAPPRR